MVLWKPHGKVSITGKGNVTYVVTRYMGPREKAEFRTEIYLIRWEPLFRLTSDVPKHPDCGLVITGDFNQMSDNFLKTHYRLVQVVDIPARGNAILDKLWSNMADVVLILYTGNHF